MEFFLESMIVVVLGTMVGEEEVMFSNFCY
jgi:hypothetical protein